MATERRDWGYALSSDTYNRLTDADHALIEQAKSIGWRVEQVIEKGVSVWLLLPGCDDQPPSFLWRSYENERDAWTKLPLDFMEWGAG